MCSCTKAWDASSLCCLLQAASCTYLHFLLHTCLLNSFKRRWHRGQGKVWTRDSMGEGKGSLSCLSCCSAAAVAALSLGNLREDLGALFTFPTPSTSMLGVGLCMLWWGGTILVASLTCLQDALGGAVLSGFVAGQGQLRAFPAGGEGGIRTPSTYLAPRVGALLVLP